MNLDFKQLKPHEILAYLVEAGKQERVLRGQPSEIIKRNNADADGGKLPDQPAPTNQGPTIVIQEVVVRTREEVKVAIEDARAQGIPLLSGGD